MNEIEKQIKSFNDIVSKSIQSAKETAPMLERFVLGNPFGKKKVISFSLYGNLPKYDQGMLANIALAKEIYPGWQVRVYVPWDYQLSEQLHAAGAEVCMVNDDRIKDLPMCWRFLACEDPEVHVAIFRDADSRLSIKEKVAVDEWLNTGRVFHIMRGHVNHYCYPILGGMWGVYAGNLQLFGPMTKWNISRYSGDMMFLEQYVWPHVTIRNAIVHGVNSGDRPFPSHPPCEVDFIGQSWEADGSKEVVR
jgi:hypothetical protein